MMRAARRMIVASRLETITSEPAMTTGHAETIDRESTVATGHTEINAASPTMTNTKAKNMKKTIITTLMAAAFAATVSAQDTTYKVTGTVPAGTQRVFLVTNNDRRTVKVDSTLANGKFAFDGSAPKDALFNIVYVTDKQRDNIILFNDGTPIDVNFTASRVNASTQNLKLSGFWKLMEDYFAKQDALDKEMNGGVASAARKSELRAELDRLDKESTAALVGFIRLNKDNILPAALASDFAYSLEYDDLATFCDSTSAYFNHPAMTSAKRLYQGLGKRRPGLQYHELTMQDMQGKTVSLSQWAGKGNYVLVDFWASWCGPCRREMPYVVDAYKRYHASKGFEIVGVSFDNNADKWKACVEELGLDWPQMSDLKGWQCAASQAYGVSSIPSNVLLDPTGKIIATDLRGTALVDKLKEVYGE